MRGTILGHWARRGISAKGDATHERTTGICRDNSGVCVLPHHGSPRVPRRERAEARRVLLSRARYARFANSWRPPMSTHRDLHRATDVVVRGSSRSRRGQLLLIAGFTVGPLLTQASRAHATLPGPSTVP